ncbi:YncE family protein [uncultured Hymenobacter sp.]|uniref:YncE family protein n=1 Tax=uncultured Hymenobacter sp. TaxID=170016 RepID=UPI0035CA7BE2
MKKQLIPFFAALAVLSACDPDKETPPAPATTDVFILSEGQFQAGDGAVSAFDKTTKALTVDAFGAANDDAKLGDVVQSMGVQGSRGYVVVNASNKIEVVNLPDFKRVATITALEQPRYFTSTSATRGYVTEWRGPYTGYLPGVLSILNLTSNTVASRVPVGRNPEQLLALGGKIYVPNSLDNTISVIDEATGQLSSTITVADGPASLVADKDNNVWALCTGFVTYLSTPPYTATRVSNGTLIRFSPNSPATQLKFSFPATGSPGKLRISPGQDQLYYQFNGAEYQMSVTASTLPTTPFIRRNFSGFAIDPRDNTIFGAISPSYSTNGKFIRYQDKGATAVAIDSFEVKVGPNGFVFY